eukprot:TRINITY_DN3582_c0_g1_i1.p1 TRINITY_DN3582_c0_g1~~TRINITY_DN3582_c0_g1_i1.p1  ORF type:complete len:509 (-),score=102.28 TRINITY_DN3582_c0_g1_i1:437-1963(-)
MSVAADSGKEEPIYETRSVCPVCSVIERKGFEWIPAFVYQKGNCVWLRYQCKMHGERQTLYCSDAGFFRKVLSYSEALSAYDGKRPTHALSAQYLRRMLRYQSDATNHPLMAEVSVFRSGQFASDGEIKATVNHILSIYDPSMRFVLKVCGRLCNDIAMFNEKLAFIETVLKLGPIVVELSYDRLIALSQLQDTALLRGRFYPSVKMFVRPGDEAQCLRELQELLSALKAIEGIQVIVTLSLERPFPRLDSILQLLRSEHGYVKFIQLSLERSPKKIIQSLAAVHGHAHLAHDQFRSPHLLSPASAANDSATTTPTPVNVPVATGTADVSVDSLGSPPRVTAPADVSVTGSEPETPPRAPTVAASAFELPSPFTSPPATPNADASFELNTADPFEFMKLLERETNGEIVPDDFHPASIGIALEPFLGLLGFGNYSIRSAPFDGFGTVLLNSDKWKSVPLSRLLNVEKLYRGLLPELPALKEAKSIGMFAGMRLKKVKNHAHCFVLFAD